MPTKGICERTSISQVRVGIKKKVRDDTLLSSRDKNSTISQRLHMFIVNKNSLPLT